MTSIYVSAPPYKDSPYETRADPNPVVKAEMIMLAKAAVDRFEDKANAYA